jgi:hypothetical protein
MIMQCDCRNAYHLALIAQPIPAPRLRNSPTTLDWTLHTLQHRALQLGYAALVQLTSSFPVFKNCEGTTDKQGKTIAHLQSPQ